MKGRLFPSLIVAGLLGGCATSSPELYTYRDQNISGDVFQMTRDNLLTGNATQGTEVWLDGSRIVQPRGTILYHLEVHYASTGDFLNIEAGPSLVVTADGEPMSFSGMGSSSFRKTAKSGEKTEFAVYPCTGADVRKIAAAHEVKVELIGSKGTVTRTFSPTNSQNFRQFVTNYMDR